MQWPRRLEIIVTHTDKNGVACVYGAAAGFTIDTAICSSMVTPDDNSPEPGVASSLTFTGETINFGQENRYPTMQVVPGSQFIAAMTGAGNSPGDPDLYLSFDATPHQLISYDCRPFLNGADETCDVVVPNGVSIARIMVHGFSKGEYDLNVSFVAPTQ